MTVSKADDNSSHEEKYMYGVQELMGGDGGGAF